MKLGASSQHGPFDSGECPDAAVLKSLEKGHIVKCHSPSYSTENASCSLFQHWSRSPTVVPQTSSPPVISPSLSEKNTLTGTPSRGLREAPGLDPQQHCLATWRKFKALSHSKILGRHPSHSISLILYCSSVRKIAFLVSKHLGLPSHLSCDVN